MLAKCRESTNRESSLLYNDESSSKEIFFRGLILRALFQPNGHAFANLCGACPPSQKNGPQCWGCQYYSVDFGNVGLGALFGLL